MITFTPLSGGARSTRTTPLAYVLQVDDVRILLDCGSPDWCPEHGPSSSSVTIEDQSSYHWEQYCNTLRENAPSVDLVLLSHGDLAHSGLYAYAYARWGLKASTYTSLPVQAMARMASLEDVDGVRDEEEVDPPQLDEEDAKEPEGEGEGGAMESEEPKPKLRQRQAQKYVATAIEVHEAFDSVNTLRYSQPCHLQGKCQGLTITPFNAGHTLGGTIWKIRSPSAGTIVYAVNLNHMRERHLDGTVLIRPGGGGVFEPLARPDLFITDAERTNVVSSRRKDRDAALIDTITAALSRRSSLLMPCDSSTRLLELLVLLDQHWAYQRLRYPICLLSRTGREMLTFVRAMMEWLGGTISKEDVGVGEDGQGGGREKKRRRHDDDDEGEDALGALALRFKHLEFFPNPQALLNTYSSKDPKLILAVPASLSHGPSRALFCDFAAVPDNVIILTQRGEEGTLGNDLFARWNNSQRADDKWDKGKIGNNVMLDGALALKMNSKVPLQGEELEEYLAKERAAKEKEAAAQAAENFEQQRVLEADEDDTDTDSDSDEEDEVERALAADLMDVAEDITAPAAGGGFAEPGGQSRRSKRGRGVDDGDWGLDADEGLNKQLLSFDIYLKGNVSRATSFFKSADGQSQQRFRMFPFVEKKRRVDDYGETIDVGMWLRTGKKFEEEAESDEMKELKRNQAEEEIKKTPKEPPSKFVSSNVEVQLACRLLFVDMEGLNDGRAVKTIVPQVNPRKMIIVHAPTDAVDGLIESCGNIRAMTKEIYAPELGQTVSIGQQTNSFSISLSEDLVASIKMSSFEDNEVGYVTGRIAIHAGSTVPMLEPLAGSAAAKKSKVLPARSGVIGMRAPVTLPRSTMIGELKLTTLKSRLASVGVRAELVGEGVLICGKRTSASEPLEGTVAVRKSTRGRVELEGAASDVYYTVRREIYKLHALVAA